MFCIYTGAFHYHGLEEKFRCAWQQIVVWEDNIFHESEDTSFNLKSTIGHRKEQIDVSQTKSPEGVIYRAKMQWGQ